MTFELNSGENESVLESSLGDRVLDRRCMCGECEAWEVGPIGITEQHMQGMHKEPGRGMSRWAPYAKLSSLDLFSYIRRS